jgi:hypothetical protein
LSIPARALWFNWHRGEALINHAESDYAMSLSHRLFDARTRDFGAMNEIGAERFVDHWSARLKCLRGIDYGVEWIIIHFNQVESILSLVRIVCYNYGYRLADIADLAFRGHRMKGFMVGDRGARQRPNLILEVRSGKDRDDSWRLASGLYID